MMTVIVLLALLALLVCGACIFCEQGVSLWRA